MNLRNLALAALAALLLVVQPYRPYVVSGESMSPTFTSGEWLLGDARPREIGRGDVVVFRRGSETMIKRVALLPGDHLERYRFRGHWDIPPNAKVRSIMVRQALPRQDLVVPEGQFYVLGDNLDRSVDSRSYGTISLADVLAVVPSTQQAAEEWTAPIHLTRAIVAGL